MKTISDIREEISRAIDLVKTGKMTFEQANAIVKLTNCFIETLRLEFHYRQGVKEAALPKPVVAAALPEPKTPTNAQNGKCPPEYVEVGAALEDRFKISDLRDLMAFPHKAGEWLADWKQRGWIDTMGQSAYQKTSKFPHLHE